MMVFYVVVVRPGSFERYTDSSWVVLANAERRVNDLVTEFDRRGRVGISEEGTDGWRAWVTTATIEDAVIEDPKPKALKPPKKIST